MIIVNGRKVTKIDSMVSLMAELQAAPHSAFFLLRERAQTDGVQMLLSDSQKSLLLRLLGYRVLCFKVEKHFTNYHSLQLIR